MKLDEKVRYFSKLSVLLAAVITCGPTKAVETTRYGKIVGLETRPWGLHVQTDFSAGASLGCEATVGALYMYDFSISKANRSGHNADLTMSILLAAFASGDRVSFHLYECSGVRPQIGYVRVSKK